MKITHIPSTHYSEVPQKSPLRWCLLLLKPDGTAVGQHGWWKCKDFLNDVVIFRRLKKPFSIYSFDNKIEEQEGGFFYIALKNVPEFFEANLKQLNQWLVSRDMPPVELFPQDKDFGCGVERVISVPKYYFDNTFFISVITSLIRSCVYVKATTLEECVKQEPTFEGYLPQVYKLFLPSSKEAADKLVFSNMQYNGGNIPSYSHLMHDAGLQRWIDSESLE